MVKCGICGGEAPKQPCITEDGKCDLCGRKVKLADDEDQDKITETSDRVRGKVSGKGRFPPARV